MEEIASRNPGAKVIMSGILSRNPNLYKNPAERAWDGGYHLSNINEMEVKSNGIKSNGSQSKSCMGVQ